MYLFGIGAIAVMAVVLVNDDDSTSATAQPAATTLSVELTEFKIGGDLAAPAGQVEARGHQRRHRSTTT